MLSEEELLELLRNMGRECIPCPHEVRQRILLIIREVQTPPTSDDNSK